MTKNKALVKRLKITGLFSLITNLVLSVIKFVAGHFGNSYALIADAIESFLDALGSLMFMFGIRYATKPADENHPYGHGKAEPLITFVVVGFLILSAIVIVYNSVQNIMTPHGLPKPYTVYVLLGVILIKEVIYRIIKRQARITKSNALKAEAWHHRGDAITSVAALIGVSFALCFGEEYEAADDWAAIFASILILYNAYRIFRPALGEVMDEHFYDEMIIDIRKISTTVPGVIETEKCFVRKTGLVYHVDLHLIVDGEITVKAGHKIAHDLKSKLIQEIPQIADVLIHVEPN
ncbi:cation diffusion facilitator family transporter [Crocinitomix catalasitica]|uniref:cation diffusion facilitator family transporter n=1 Tax=Crocinitomix catalasitica TaxID=184607 RepID=UPI0006851753